MLYNTECHRSEKCHRSEECHRSEREMSSLRGKRSSLGIYSQDTTKYQYANIVDSELLLCIVLHI